MAIQPGRTLHYRVIRNDDKFSQSSGPSSIENEIARQIDLMK